MLAQGGYRAGAAGGCKRHGDPPALAVQQGHEETGTSSAQCVEEMAGSSHQRPSFSSMQAKKRGLPETAQLQAVCASSPREILNNWKG